MTAAAQEEAVRMADGAMMQKAAEGAEALSTIDNLLRSIEGMQGQMSAMTELIVAMEQRISDLESGTKPRKLLQVRN